MQPKHISINQNTSVSQFIEPGKVSVIVLDGNQNAAYVVEAPEHGHTIIETFKGGFDRVRFDHSYKVKK
ncbi:MULTISPECIES: XtrA/YqaO family protein [Bacillus]|uniref:XtrA/YqaO family protein n=1 Tax=Bacillus TaxID=1386 RepID=UPI0006AE1791|nr:MULTISPECIES: XtrA/YqaO family protein [Bacillus]AWD88521.1 hypothetical protein BVQ_14035 [Bacillus velezensis]KAF6695434.1 hypothetical protein G9362_07455 [Bacillus sp. EKM601B]KOS49024.1 phage portal protein [Bacillus amyloliquefaciens]MBA9148943.1 hypothetical protein [Bacillus sp. EKM213B]MDZ7433653.1 XtrA/YqaO family protein [Bacillus amyloliquefaciens]